MSMFGVYDGERPGSVLPVGSSLTMCGSFALLQSESQRRSSARFRAHQRNRDAAEGPTLVRLGSSEDPSRSLPEQLARRQQIPGQTEMVGRS
jgi:hypothetical protein